MARLVEAGADVRYVAFSIATRSLPEGFAPDTLAREVREATAEIGIPAGNLIVDDFDVRTFPGHRQEILELLIEIWKRGRPARSRSSSPASRSSKNGFRQRPTTSAAVSSRRPISALL
jgi:hypothetical protein